MSSHPRNIVLVGFMGAGKSAVGAALARMTGYKLVELDAEIERAAGMRIADIFAAEGEGAFRDLESAALVSVLAHDHQIVSTGGGAVIREDNLKAMKSGGVVVRLAVTADTVYERTKRSTHRPLLQTENPQERISQLMGEREPYYAQADYTVDTEGKSPWQLSEEILEGIGWSA